ncbi:MAG TPA: right-handed parallel beta-helix repeat-containing protein, partial [Kiritimatiellia bacterium]|nr:right-handed parallel beta-helix repeat-containing protein [Kiritimatiellia bacterium]
NDICGQTFAGLWLPTPPGLLEVLRNRVCDNHPYGVLIDQARQLRFASNLILGNSTGLWLWQGSAWNSPLNAAVYNNAVVGNRDYGVRLTAWRSGAGVQVLNNIVAFNAGKGLLVQGRPFQGVLAYNDFFQNAGGAVAGLAADPIGRQGNIAADPRFLDHNGALSGNYHLAPGSPCLHAGSPAPAFRNADGSRNTMGLYGGPERRPALGWATTWKGLALLYVDHGRGDVLLCHTNARGSICRANPFNGGAWVVANHYRPLEGSSIVAVDSQGRELQRFPGFTECLDIWQSVELSVDPRDGSCWVADTRDAFRHGGPGRLAKLTLDGRIAVDLEIPGLTDVEVARPDGLVAASAGESHAFVHFFTPDGTPVASADAGEGMAIGVAVNPPGGNLLLACDSHWAWLSLDDPGVVLQQAPARLGPRTSSVTVDPNSGRILMTAFAEEDTQLSLFAPDGVVLRNSNLQGRNCSPSLTSACDVDPRDSFFIGSCYLWGEEERRWLEGIAFLDPELVEPVSRLDGPCSSVSLLRP